VKPVYLFLLVLLFCGCRKETEHARAITRNCEVRFASGFSLVRYGGFTVLSVSHPWPSAEKTYRYVLAEKGAHIPDSLSQIETIRVPVKRLVATSTTHLPSLEMLGSADALVGFPMLGWISSGAFKKRIAAGKIRELGSNQNLNTETVLALQPDVIIGYGIDNHNPSLDNLQRSGLKVVLDGDWNEQTPLGKAEWLKLFGALLGKRRQADSLFQNISERYQNLLKEAANMREKPTVLIGGLYENRWNVPKGDSWGAIFVRDAGGHYLWNGVRGTGSLALSFESVLEKAADADVWIAPGTYSSLEELTASNPHYAQFSAFRNHRVFGFRKGAGGGILYYELAPNRPDLVLEDLMAIFFPEKFPKRELIFFKKL
jgi:iron complex transport system substrate-binding protein